MAIQIRRGSNAEWEVNNSNIVVGEPAVATDSKRAFIGTASGAYMELANLEAIAPAYDPGNSYMIDDYVSYQGKLHVCTVPTSGAWDASAWQVTSLGQALAENQYSNYETYTMSGDIVSFPNGAGGVPVKDLQVSIEAVQSGSGDPSPTNVRPISGWGEVNVSVAGENLLGKTAEDFAQGTLYGLSRYLVMIVPNGTYTISTDAPTGYIWGGYSPATSGYIRIFDGSPRTINITDGKLYIGVLNSDIQTALSYHTQIELGSTATAYEEYRGQTHTTDLDGTRYGGTLDVTTGVLTVTHGYVDLSTLTWSHSSANRSRNTSLNGIAKLASSTSELPPMIAEAMTLVSASTSLTYYGQLAFSTVGSTGTLIGYYDGVNEPTGGLCYELITPLTYQLTPTQVRTLLGENNIWADSGEVEVTYRISNVQ